MHNASPLLQTGDTMRKQQKARKFNKVIKNVFITTCMTMFLFIIGGSFVAVMGA